VGTDPSVDPGAKTEWGGRTPPSSIRDWHRSAKSTVVLPATRILEHASLLSTLSPFRWPRGLAYGFVRSRSFHTRLHPDTSLREDAHPKRAGVPVLDRARMNSCDRPAYEGRLNQSDAASSAPKETRRVQPPTQTDLSPRGDPAGFASRAADAWDLDATSSGKAFRVCVLLTTRLRDPVSSRRHLSTRL
jgi:hypothetical protein